MLTYGTSDPLARRLQHLLGLTEDGEVGRETMDAVMGAIRELPWSCVPRWLVPYAERCGDGGRLDEIPDEFVDVLESWQRAPISHPPTVADVLGGALEPPIPAEAPAPSLTVTAWLGWTSRKTYERELEALVDVLDGVELMGNAEDSSGRREVLGLYDRSWMHDVMETARALDMRDNGLTLWGLRNLAYMESLAAEGPAIAAELGASRLVLDCEGGWSRGDKSLSHADGAALMAGTPDLWVTGYGLAGRASMRPWMEHAGALPQPYTTSTSTTSTWRPDNAAARSAKHWRTTLGARDLRIALAAYRQDGVPGYATAADAFRAALLCAIGTGTTHIALWWTPSLAGREDLIDVLREVLA